MRKSIYFLVVFTLLLTSAVPAAGQGPGPTTDPSTVVEQSIEGLPPAATSRPAPAQPIPYHEPGHLSPAAGYSTWVERVNGEGVQETVQLNGLGAMMADGALDDPLAGNYRLVSMDKVFTAAYDRPDAFGRFSLQTYAVSPTIQMIPGSQLFPVNENYFLPYDVTAGDLNGDAIDEQIAAWIDTSPANTRHIIFDIGDMQGASANTRTTSAPAAVLRADNVLDLVVRGYDDAMWHRQAQVSADSLTWGPWDNLAGGLLLSAPVITSRGAGQLDAFAMGIDDHILPNYVVIMTSHFNGSAWSAWVVLDNPDENNPPANWPTADRLAPIPNLAAPAVVARGNQLDLFWLWPDNTLRYRHYTGSAWEAWQNLGGMLSTGPGAVALDATHTTVFAGGMDGSLWFRQYSGSWGSWNRLPLNGITTGVTIASTPTAVSPQPGRITVYLRGSDEQLWQNLYNGSAWGGWTPASGVLASGVAAAVSQATNKTYLYAQDPEGSLQEGIASGSGLPGWEPGWSWLEACCQNQPYDTGVDSYTGNWTGHPEDNINDIAVRTGNLLGDGRQQIVLGYRRSSYEVALQVYDVRDGLRPKPLLASETLRTGYSPKLTMADFNKDGLDEIGLFYSADNSLLPAEDISVGVELFRLNTASWMLESIAHVEYPLVKFGEVCGSGLDPGASERTFNIEAGDLDGNGDAEIVISWDIFGRCGSPWVYQATYSVLDVTAMGIDLKYTQKWTHPGLANAYCCSTDVELAVGDVDGNGIDEVIRTYITNFNGNRWPEAYRNMEVLDSRDLANPVRLAEVGFDGWSSQTWRDELAVGDLDRDLIDEIVFFESDSDDVNDLDSLWFYNYNNGALQALPKYFEYDFGYTPLIATGDFTGESLRVGPPDYRRQYSVGGITAIINAPPKHSDILNGKTVDINSQDQATKALLTLGESSSTNVSISTSREFSLASNFTAVLGNPEATHTKDSIGLSYGYNFERTEGTFAKVEFKETRTASNDDALFYLRTDYEVWEYPVYDMNSNTPASYLTVVFPMDTPRMRVDRGNTCDSWYRSRHQLGNVWSYPQTQDSFFDIAEQISSRSEYLVSSDSSDFSYLFESGDVSRYSSQMKMGISNEFEFQIGGEEVTFSLFDFVAFSARLPSFMWSMKTDYNHSELSTLEITTNNSTQLNGYLNGVPDADALGYDYAVRPYLYWSTDGAMVLDYTASPEGYWWNSNYSDPDPAFILPWSNGQCGPDKLEFTRDILNDPPVASEGQVITTTAVVRNFSNAPNPHAFQVSFYQGDPDAGARLLGSQTIGAYELDPREVIPVSIQWNAKGMGDQRIYAVIDPLHQLEEVHDERDAQVNNNKGYALLKMGNIDFIDIGLKKEIAYDAIEYAMGDTLRVTFYIPPGNLPETARFDLGDTLVGMRNVVGNPFELAAYIGSSNTNPWTKPIDNYPLTPGGLNPPAALAISYGNNDLGGFNENNLMLYRKTNSGWVDATCAGFSVQRLTSDNLLVVPICQTGVFALSVTGPTWPILIPVVLR